MPSLTDGRALLEEKLGPLAIYELIFPNPSAGSEWLDEPPLAAE